MPSPFTNFSEIPKNLDSGACDVTWMTASLAFPISKGIAQYKQYGKRSFYMMIHGGAGHLQLITTDPNIKSIADWKGKRVSGRGLANPQTFDLIRAALLSIYDMTDDDIKLIPSQMATQDMPRHLKEGVADVAIMTALTGAATIEELAVTKDIYFIPLSAEEQASVKAKLPYFASSVIPAGTYPKQDSDVPALVQTQGIFIRHDFDQELAYQMVKAMYEHQDELFKSHSNARFWDIKYAVQTEAIFHPYAPGTVRFLKEKGLWTPEAEAVQQKLLTEAGLN